MNDPEVIESLRYLLVPKAEKIRLSALPFDAKKQCFVAEKTEGFIDALIESEDGDMVTVKTSKGIVSLLGLWFRLVLNFYSNSFGKLYLKKI